MTNIRTGYIYVLKAGPWTKIGKTKDLETRVRRLSIQLPFPVELEHSIACASPDHIEKVLHWMLGEYRLNGEWFQLPRKVIDALRAVPAVRCKGMGNGELRIPRELRGVADACPGLTRRYEVKRKEPSFDDPLRDIAGSFLEIQELNG